MPDLSIIIVSYKGRSRLIRCLDSLNSVMPANFSFEVIMVDNGSDNELITDIEMQYPRFRIIRNTFNGGFGNGCNIGAKNASGNFLLFLNPDTVVTEAELLKFMDVARKHPHDILSCRQVNENGKEKAAYGEFPRFNNLTGFQRSVFRGTTVRYNNGATVIHPDWVSGSVMLMSREVFQKLGGFDEDFWMYFEDVDICKRARNTGIEIVLRGDISIEHNHGGSSRINMKTASLTKTEVHISRHVYISKHKKGFERFLIHAFLVLNNLVSGLIMAFVGLILFFLPKLFMRLLIFFNLLSYYIRSVFRLSWISPRSINFNKTLRTDA